VYLEFLHGSWGGRQGHDGIDASASVVVNFSNTPIELVEAGYPLRVEQYGFLPDTGGAGTFRGGLGMVKELRFLEAEGALQIRADRQRFRPYGLAGGQPGAPGANFLRPSDAAEWERQPAKTLLEVRRGDRFRHILPGAGGWGPPLERDPTLVLEDVRQEKITPGHAREAYGVVVREDGAAGWELDEEGTARLRGETCRAGDHASGQDGPRGHSG
jgi:N-methylhydantoinase B